MERAQRRRRPETAATALRWLPAGSSDPFPMGHQPPWLPPTDTPVRRGVRRTVEYPGTAPVGSSEECPWPQEAAGR